MRNKKSQVILTAIICLLPILLGVLLYEQFPSEVPVQWDAEGEINRVLSRPLAVFGLPLFFLAVHLFTVFMLQKDPKKDNHSKIMQQASQWIAPLLSIILVPLMFLAALGENISMPFVVSLLLGVFYILIGNYLPKNRQNYVIGLKLPWTLNSQNNWNKTHRLAGTLFLAAGIIIFLSTFFLMNQYAWVHTFIMLGSALSAAFIPTVYSYILYKKGQV